MFSVNDFKSISELTLHISKSVAKKIEYDNVCIKSFNNDESFQLIEITKENMKSVFLNLFIVIQDNFFNINILKGIIGKNCLGCLSKEESERIGNDKIKMFSYSENFFIALEEINNISEAQLLLLFNEENNPNFIILDDSVVSKRKKISDMINNYFSTLEEIKNKNNSEIIEHFQNFNIENEIIQKIAEETRIARKFKRKDVAITEKNGEFKVTIRIGNDASDVETIYLLLKSNEKYISIYNIFYDGAQWKNRTIPNTIESLLTMFNKKG